MKIWKRKRMSRVLALALALFMVIGLVTVDAVEVNAAEEGTSIEINESVFPDAIFREYVGENFDIDGDGYLSMEEIENITVIDVSSMGISDLSGIKIFSSLVYLDCILNKLTSLDVSGCNALEELNCDWNALTSLDVSGCSALKILKCEDNDLAEINVAGLSNLSELKIMGNQLTSLDVSGCIALENLDCHYNRLENLDVSECNSLKSISCWHNDLTSLDISNNLQLQTLDCFANKLASLDVSNNLQLQELWCGENQLTSLDVSNCSKLVDLSCMYNAMKITLSDTRQFDLSILPNFDVSKVSSVAGGVIEGNILTFDEAIYEVTYNYDIGKGYIEEFKLYRYLEINESVFPDAIFRGYVEKNIDIDGDGYLSKEEIENVTEINVSSMGISDLSGVEVFSKLDHLDCSSNLLTSIDVSDCSELYTLYCWENELTSLNVNGCSRLTNLLCGLNMNLTSIDVSGCSNLAFFDCWQCWNLTSLNVKGCSKLIDLLCWDCNIRNLDISDCVLLNTLECQENQLACLDVSNCSKLTDLSCYGNVMEVTLSDTRQFDLSTLLDFDISKVSSVVGGTIEGNILTFDEGASKVTYNYDVGQGYESEFTLLTKDESALIEINETVFPDAIFREYVGENFDIDGDGYLSMEEIENITVIDVSSMGISDLSGIEKFSNLSTLDCANNNLTSLDVSECSELYTLWCYDNDFRSLNVSGCSKLNALYCSIHPNLTSIDVSGCSELTILSCMQCLNLTSLNVSGCSALVYLDCIQTNIRSLDISSCVSLETLECWGNQLASLDVSNCSKLTDLICYDNVMEVTLSDTRQFDLSTLSDFDISKVSSVTGGTIEGDILTFDEGVNRVTYNYDVGQGYTEEFAFSSEVKITLMNFDDSEYTMEYGDEMTLNVTILPENATNKNLIWKASNTKAVEVDNNGKVTAVGAGVSNIIARPADGSDSVAFCTVTVYKTYGKPDAPVAESITDKSVTLKAVSGCEYSIDGKNWQKSNTFSGLKSDTKYTFYARKKASGYYKSSPASAGLSVRTKKSGGSTGTPDDTTRPDDTIKPVTVSYRTHVQSFGWQDFVTNGAMSGTSGQAKRLEGIEIKVSGNDKLGIRYKTHVQSYGWQDWKLDGDMSGTSGESKRLEAICIELTGADKNKYDVYYRVHAQSYGWLGWAKNGQPAGTAAQAKRLEGIEIKVLPKGMKPEGMIGYSYIELGKAAKNEQKSGMVNYMTHVQSYGDQPYVYDGSVSGTFGEAKRLEGIRINLNNDLTGVQGGITYRTHVQTHGWLDWSSDGDFNGTQGEAKRLEAIEIKLTGDMADKYDVYYRVHAQSYGWLGWAKNGESAGTAGYAKRLEGIQIVLLPKGSPAPSVLPGAEGTPAFIAR